MKNVSFTSYRVIIYFVRRFRQSTNYCDQLADQQLSHTSRQLRATNFNEYIEFDTSVNFTESNTS